MIFSHDFLIFSHKKYRYRYIGTVKTIAIGSITTVLMWKYQKLMWKYQFLYYIIIREYTFGIFLLKIFLQVESSFLQNLQNFFWSLPPQIGNTQIMFLFARWARSKILFLFFFIFLFWIRSGYYFDILLWLLFVNIVEAY